MESPVFEWACEVLERGGSLSRLQARGTMRLVLRHAGLDPRSLRVAQLRVIADRLMPKELKARGVQNGSALCTELAACPAAVESSAEALPTEAEDIFKRLGRKADE